LNVCSNFFQSVSHKMYIGRKYVHPVNGWYQNTDKKEMPQSHFKPKKKKDQFPAENKKKAHFVNNFFN
jgi:hypothetical protein